MLKLFIGFQCSKRKSKEGLIMVREQNKNITNSLRGRQKKCLEFFSNCLLLRLGFYGNGLYPQALPDVWEEMAGLQGYVKTVGMKS